VDQVVIRDNVRLQSGPLFLSSTRIEDVSIARNPSLMQLLGFSTVREARRIEIVENANLTAIDLGALQSVRRLDIRCNATLPESSLEPLRSLTGQVRISGNLGSSSRCQWAAARAPARRFVRATPPCRVRCRSWRGEG
jgi:hypothetical protein